MRICELVLRNFGKFTDKRIELSNGIQLIYGENESGKSTIHSFIKGMFFGIERGRGRAAIMMCSAVMSHGTMRRIIRECSGLKAAVKCSAFTETSIKFRKRCE